MIEKVTTRSVVVFVSVALIGGCCVSFWIPHERIEGARAEPRCWSCDVLVKKPEPIEARPVCVWDVDGSWLEGILRVYVVLWLLGLCGAGLWWIARDRASGKMGGAV